MTTLPDCLVDSLRLVCQQYTNGFPSWLMASRVCPISKSWSTPNNAQVRPITIMSQVYRLYGILVCRQILRQWGLCCPASVTGLLPGRGAHLAAYSQQLQLEFHRSTNEAPSGLTFDIIKCYNHIRQDLAFRLLRCMKVPEAVVSCLEGSLANLTRSWQISQQTWGAHHATWGFPEGDAHSVVVMVALATAWTSALSTITGGEVSPVGYADNWGWSCLTIPPQALAMDFTVKFTNLFGLSIDFGKTWMWAAQSQADNVNVHAHVSSRGELLNFLRTWRPDDGIVFEREDISEWADDFSWGASLANSLVDWISLCFWPREPPSYMPASGVSLL